MKATSFSSSISANLDNSGEAMVEIFTSTRSSNEEEANWLHFRTFCELVEGGEQTNYIFHMDYNIRV